MYPKERRVRDGGGRAGLRYCAEAFCGWMERACGSAGYQYQMLIAFFQNPSGKSTSEKREAATI